MLTIGDRVPRFALMSEQGEVKSSDLKGKRYILYFYPTDDTPGCTKEACSFRDNLPKFKTADVPIFGVSPQDVNSKKKFAAKYSLNFPLLADTDHKLAEAFGAWVEKNMYGRKSMGIQRSTFVIGPDGRIEHVWPKVKPEGHAEEVLAYLNNITTSQPDNLTT
jgi:peroxiredoxin Q/BCP